MHAPAARAKRAKLLAPTRKHGALHVVLFVASYLSCLLLLTHIIAQSDTSLILKPQAITIDRNKV